MARPSFETALAFVLRHEGGFSHHPEDPGGATHRGITLATLSAWRGRAVAVADLKALTLEETAAIYRARYWDAVAGDDLPAGLDLVVFDAAVNSGPRRAALWLQPLLEVPADGIIGPLTLKAVRSAEPRALIDGVTTSRQAFVERLPTFRTFGRGWSRRIAAARAAGLALLAQPRSTPRPLEKETPMTPTFSPEATKPAFASRTLWANAIGLLALALSWFGFTIPGLDTGILAESLFQGIAGLGFVASTLFRLLATRRLLP